MFAIFFFLNLHYVLIIHPVTRSLTPGCIWTTQLTPLCLLWTCQISFVWCFHSSKPSFGVGKRSWTTASCPTPGFWATKYYLLSCISVPAGGLLSHSLYRDHRLFYSPLLFSSKTGVRTPDWVPEAQKLCLKQLRLPHPDKRWKCLRPLSSVSFFWCQPPAMVDTRLCGNWELGLLCF